MLNSKIDEIIGGTYEHKGSQYDNFEKLINDYISLFIDTIMGEGIVYSTGRNGILARIECDLEKGCLVNYVQSSIGTWEYENPKYQRIVSPEFALFMFDMERMKECYMHINTRADYSYQPTVFNKKKQVLNGIYFKDLGLSGIKNLYDKIILDEFKEKNGENNKSEQMDSLKKTTVKFLYDLMKTILQCSRNFHEKFIRKQKESLLKEKLNSGEIDYNDLSKDDKKLLDEFRFYHDDKFYSCFPSLGFLNKSIRQMSAKKLFERCKQKEQCDKKGRDFRELCGYDDPIKKEINFHDGNLDEIFYDGFTLYDDEEKTKMKIAIDYSDAKEFEESLRTSLHIVSRSSKPGFPKK